ncbi:MAG: hypothetical protein KJ067_18260 [Vicinamibacteria bacterium]|nr:hypothetical protein [Vicinamibacteria bacterium]
MRSHVVGGRRAPGRRVARDRPCPTRCEATLLALALALATAARADGPVGEWLVDPGRVPAAVLADARGVLILNAPIASLGASRVALHRREGGVLRLSGRAPLDTLVPLTVVHFDGVATLYFPLIARRDGALEIVRDAARDLRGWMFAADLDVRARAVPAAREIWFDAPASPDIAGGLPIDITSLGEPWLYAEPRPDAWRWRFSAAWLAREQGARGLDLGALHLLGVRNGFGELGLLDACAGTARPLGAWVRVRSAAGGLAIWPAPGRIC